MKQVITNYSFNSSAKTVTLSDFGASHPVDLKRLYLITDVTTNQVLYNFASSSIATASISSNNVVTLSAVPGGVANGDSLQIIYEVLATDPTYETPLLPANASQETGGNLANINTNTGPLVVSSAGGYVRQDSTGTIAKETGGNLATIATNTGSLTSGSQLTKITDGTNTANVVAGDSGFNGISSASATKTYTFTTSTTGAQTIGPYQCEGFIWVEVVYTSVGSGLALNGQFCPSSGGTYLTQTAWGNNTGALSSSLGAASGTIYYSPVHGNYFQIAVSALTSGTFAGTITFRSVAPPISTISATGSINTTSNNTVNTGTITTSSSSITTTGLNGYGGFATVSIHGAYVGVSFGITESDDSGTTYYNVPIYDQSNMRWLAAGSTISPGSNVSNVYWLPIYGGGDEIKVLASAYTSGTANIRISQASTPMPGSFMSQLMDAAGNARGANVNASNQLQTVANPPTVSTIVSGQQTATTSATALTSNTLSQGITIEALSTNTISVFIGASGVTSSTGIELPAGAALTLPVGNSNNIYIVCASGSPVVTFIGA